MSMETKNIPFGNGVILATKPDFLNGFQAGNRAYLDAMEHHPEPYTDEYITELFLEKLEDMKLSSLYSVGYAVGWLGTLVITNQP